MATLNSWATSVANSIRGKTGKNEPISTLEFASEIDSIATGGGSIDPLINPTWWDIESIITNYNSNNTGHIHLLPDTDDVLNFTPSSTGSTNISGTLITSDGGNYSFTNSVTGITHTWDKNQDKPCYINGVEVYRTRWIMIITNDPLSTNTSRNLIIPTNTLYSVINGGIWTNSSATHGFGSKAQLMFIKGLNNAKTGAISASYFNGCSALRRIDEFTVTGWNNSTFSGCTSLESIVITPTTNQTITTAQFSGLSSLTNIYVDMTNQTSVNTMASGNCPSVKSVIYKGLTFGVNLSYFPALSNQALLNFRDNLGVPNGPQTITLNNTLKNRLTSQDIADWEALGWTLV